MEKITFTNNTGEPISADNLNKMQQNTEDAIRNLYQVGDLYITTSSTNPADRFGGTWEQIKDDCYLKIVSSGAGKQGGTSKEHKIPISSMPRHRHGTSYADLNVGHNGWDVNDNGGAYRVSVQATSAQYTGEDEAYYPYYLGVFVWVKTAD